MNLTIKIDDGIPFLDGVDIARIGIKTHIECYPNSKILGFKSNCYGNYIGSTERLKSGNYIARVMKS